MDISDLKKMTVQELQKELNELFREQFNLRIQKNTGQLKRTNLIKEVRLNIARAKTFLHEKKMMGKNDE